jgi:hypothetical protein
MAQLSSVTGMRRLNRNQTAELNARLQFLPQMLAQKSQREFQDAQLIDLAERRKLEEARFGIEQSKFGLAEKEFGLKERGLGLQEKGLALDERGLGLQEQGLGIQREQLAQGERQFNWQADQASAARELQKETEKREMGVKAAGLGFTAIGGGLGGKTTLGSITAGATNIWNKLFNEGAPEISPKSEGLMGTNLGAIAGGGLIGFGAGQAFGGKDKVKKIAIGAGIGGIASLLADNGNLTSAIGGGLLGGLGGLF